MKRVLVAGGGSGGHVFPAIAIANEVVRRWPQADVLFVGAQGKMEVTAVPAAGYRIVALPIRGLVRGSIWKNIGVPFRLLYSVLRALAVIRRFRPNVVVGVGGYASAPVLVAAAMLSVPTIIQEQNSFAGLTNRKLAGHVAKVCVAFEGMERYFDAQKIVNTGNPIRKSLLDRVSIKEARAHFGIEADKKVVLMVGGSLGARTFNDVVVRERIRIGEADELVLIWQVGSFYYEEYSRHEVASLTNVRCLQFVQRMDLAYALADVVVSRAGAIAIAELAALGKSAILVPSPNVAEDHQTKNASAIAAKNAAILVRDDEAGESLWSTVLGLLDDEKKKNALAENIALLGRRDADRRIVDVLESVAVEV